VTLRPPTRLGAPHPETPRVIELGSVTGPPTIPYRTATAARRAFRDCQRLLRCRDGFCALRADRSTPASCQGDPAGVTAAASEGKPYGAPTPPGRPRGHWVLSAGKLSLGTLASRVLGVVRDILRAYLFGTGMAADAFTVAFRLPNMLRALFAEGALSAAFVPVLTESMEREGPDAWKRLVLRVGSLLALALTLVALLGILIAPYLIPLIVPGYARVPGKIELTVTLTRWLFPYIFFIGLATLAMGTLNARRRFTTPAMSAAVLNLAMIAAMAWLCPRLGPDRSRMIIGLAWGVLVGGALQLAIQIPPLLREGIWARFRLTLRDPRIRRIGALMLPGVVGLGVAEINAFVDTFLASLLPGGSVAALEYGQRVMQLPLGVFAVALGTAVLPTLSRHAAREETTELTDSFRLALRLTGFILLPVTGLFLVVHRPLLRLLFERGAFADGRSLEMTALAFVCYTVGLCAYGAVKIIVPVFYARQNTRTPVRIAATAMLANIGLNLVLMQFFQLGGLALATALASMLNVALLLRELRRRYNLTLGADVLGSLRRNALGSLIAAAVALAVLWGVGQLTIPGNFLRAAVLLGVPGGSGFAVYVAVAHRLGSRELEFLRGLRGPRGPG
ncbi:MAG: murein biosynthesis integral membrane protein MurJ, partial [Candidatus Eisenbacteria bacterium]|nr:murein biosynthesis integral membrane protein MurJ [Candidatus Eisenbacteria bacterium]